MRRSTGFGRSWRMSRIDGANVEIRITKKERRNQLTCVRPDGSRTTAGLGPGLPHHDLAHYVVERRFGLRRGFFGNIASGYSLDALSDKEVIRTLDAESLVAEILARGLGALATGACTPEQFSALVNQEILGMGLPPLESLSAEGAADMLLEFNELTGRYAALRSGDSLRLHFE